MAEDVPEGIQSRDYTDRRLAQPDKDYISISRLIKAKQNDDKSITFEVTLTGGLTKQSDGRNYLGGTYPARTWMSTRQWKREGQPGTTSGVAEYLKLFTDPATGKRYEVKGMSTADVIAAVLATTSTAIGVVVGWEDKGEVTGIDPTTGKKTYSKTVLKTKDFLSEPNGSAPHYVPEVTRDGKTYVARERVQGFRRL